MKFGVLEKIMEIIIMMTIRKSSSHAHISNKFIHTDKSVPCGLSSTSVNASKFPSACNEAKFVGDILVYDSTVIYDSEAVSQHAVTMQYAWTRPWFLVYA